jgi:hypothetical protein
MSELMNLEIAGVTLHITCRDTITLREPHSAYRYFISGNSTADDYININLDLSFDSLPSVEGMTKIFTAGQSWSLFQKGDAYLVALYAPASDKKPVWAAHFDRALKAVTIFLGESLIRETNGHISVLHPVFYPLDQILLTYFLAQKQGALIHAAGVDYNGRGFLFPGRSGAGKTTLSRQLASCNKIHLLSDDRVVARKMQGTFRVFGTPWPGEGRMAINKNVPLSGIFFMIHADYNRVEKIDPRQALELLLPVTSIPWYDPEVLDKVLHFCDDLTSSVPVYHLFFKPGSEVTDVFEKFVSG